MKELAKKAWEYILYEMDDKSWVLTVMVHRPGAEVPMSFKLTDIEIDSIRNDDNYLPELARSMMLSHQSFRARQIIPSV